ncbi:DoxX family protein [Flavobacteriaceae bacterium LYZ1037]|nr:DoxX family protein [Flavobacteriaceae bacterium LYZ1037]
MKYIVQLSRILVGVLFIISGLIKLNDPLGFSYKLQEYFSADVLNITFLEPYALAISIFVVIFEVILGVFLLIGYKPKFTVWSLLGMIVFFTFLTFYSAYFEKVKDCGCFGDAIPLTPWESFYKDVILSVLILILFFGVKHIKPIFSKLGLTVVALFSFIACLGFGYHVLMHLPSIDFRAYAVGKNIMEGMIIPEDAPKPVQEFTWTLKVNGEDKEFVTDGSYPEVDGEYVGVETKIIEEGYDPPVKDFSIETMDEDFTEYYLNKDNLIMIVMYNLDTAEKEGVVKLKTFSDEAIKKGYTVIGLTASGEEAKQQMKSQYKLNFDFFLSDEKALKTVVRASPGILKLKKGTVIQKVHWNDLEDMSLETLATATPDLNLGLKKELDSIMVLDQKYRSAHIDNEDWSKQIAIDSSNLKFVENVFKNYGYPGKSLVGEESSDVAWYVVQHSDKITEYLPLMKAAAEKGELAFSKVAMMEDRDLMRQGKEQIYGTQGRSFYTSAETEVKLIWPIQDAENVNERREKAGFLNTVEENAKRLFGDDFEFKNYTLEQVEELQNQ